MSDTPDYLSIAHQVQQPYWRTVDDVLEGTTAIRKRGETYTAKAQGESDERFKRRLERSRYYNLYKRVLDSLVGRVYRKPPKLAIDGSEVLSADVEDIDGLGTHLSVFGRRLFRKSIHHGHAAILVDAPPDPNLGRRPSVADAQRLGLRPYWVPIHAPQILSAVSGPGIGAAVLQQVAIRDDRVVPDGRFGERLSKGFRVWYLDAQGVVWEKWEVPEKGENPVRVDDGLISGLRVIPVVPDYASDPLGWFHTRPMLYDVAEANLDHYAIQSDHRYSLHVASIPIPVIKETQQPGEEKTEIPISVENGIRLYSEHGEAYFMEHQGKALNQTRDEMRDLEDRCLYLGLQTTVRRTRSAETAEAKRIDAMEQDSVLAVAARGHQDALEQALKVHAVLRGEPEPSITMSFDYDGMSMGADMFARTVDAFTAGLLRRETVWQMMEQGGILPEDFDHQAEALALDSARDLGGKVPDDILDDDLAA